MNMAKIDNLIRPFVVLSKYLSKMTRKNRLRAIDHTLIVIASLYLISVSAVSWSKTVGNPANQGLYLPQASFILTIGIILVALILCEFTIKHCI